MSLAVLDFVGKFPKKYKYVLGDRIVSDALDTLDFVIEGCHAYNRESKFKCFSRAQMSLSKADTKMMLAGAKECVTNDDLGKWMLMTVTIKKQLSGLTNSLARQSGAAQAVTETL